MSRRTTITAITAATLLALVPASPAAQTAPGGPGTTVPTTSPPGPPLIVAPQATTEGPVQPVEKMIPAPFANAATMAEDIRKRLKGNAFGWQFAIAQNGKLAVTGAGGFSRSNVDTPGRFPLDMTPTTRYEIASLSKNITAVATMKLLRMTGQSINASVDPWLPSGWVRGPGFKQKKVTFAHLLSHTSGINQMISTLPEGTLTNNRWDAMRKIVAFGTQPGSQRSYKNANYAILRIANAFMWKKLGGNIDGLAGCADDARGVRAGLRAALRVQAGRPDRRLLGRQRVRFGSQLPEGPTRSRRRASSSRRITRSAQDTAGTG